MRGSELSTPASFLRLTLCYVDCHRKVKCYGKPKTFEFESIVRRYRKNLCDIKNVAFHAQQSVKFSASIGYFFKYFEFISARTFIGSPIFGVFAGYYL